MPEITFNVEIDGDNNPIESRQSGANPTAELSNGDAGKKNEEPQFLQSRLFFSSEHFSGVAVNGGLGLMPQNFLVDLWLGYRGPRHKKTEGTWKSTDARVGNSEELQVLWLKKRRLDNQCRCPKPFNDLQEK